MSKRVCSPVSCHCPSLTGPLPPLLSASRSARKISPKARLAYDLVKRRYGVSATEIINMAPLFFTLLAEGSLARRRKEVEEGSDHLQQISSGHGVFFEALDAANGAIWEEEASISKIDLFGEHLDGNPGSPVFFDPSKNNPFVSYLRRLKDELPYPASSTWTARISLSHRSSGSPITTYVQMNSTA